MIGGGVVDRPRRADATAPGNRPTGVVGSCRIVSWRGDRSHRRRVGRAVRRTRRVVAPQGGRPRHATPPRLHRGVALRRRGVVRARWTRLLAAWRSRRLRPRRRRAHAASARPARQQPSRHPPQPRRRSPHRPAVPHPRRRRDAARQRNRRPVHRRRSARRPRVAGQAADVRRRRHDHLRLHAVPEGAVALQPLGSGSVPHARRAAERGPDQRVDHVGRGSTVPPSTRRTRSGSARRSTDRSPDRNSNDGSVAGPYGPTVPGARDHAERGARS